MPSYRKFSSRWISCATLAAACLCGGFPGLPGTVFAQALEIGPEPAPPPVFELPAFGETPVLALVDGIPVTAGEVAQRTDKLFKGLALPPEVRKKAEAEVLEQLVDERLVDRFLLEKGEVVTEQDLKAAIENVQQSLGGKPADLAAFLKRQGWTEDGLRLRLAGDLGRPAYRRRLLTPEHLAAYFEAHKKEFDGTEVRLAQILLAVPPDAPPEQIAAIQREAEQLKGQIESGKITFGEAAAKHSAAPSKFAGGDIGWAKRFGDVPEPVAQAAFALTPGSRGGWVRSRFGLHLIECLEVKPGTKTWESVRGPLMEAAGRELLREVAAKARPNAKIEYPARAAGK